MSKVSQFLEKNRRLIDRVEQVIVVLVYASFVFRLSHGTGNGLDPSAILLILSEGVVVLFLLVRRPTENIFISPWDWLVGFSGTLLPLLVVTGDTQFAPQIGAAVILTGFLLQVGAKLSLRRSFGIVAANRGVKSGGMYRVVRHPMYAGYCLTHLGFILTAPTVWNVCIYIATWSFLIARIFAEERVLSQSPEYQSYKQRVRFRLLPGIFWLLT